MKLVVYFKDCPVRTPTMPILGVKGGPYHFIFDEKRAAHCRRYDLEDQADVERLRLEQARLYNQTMPHPVFFDVEDESAPAEQEDSEEIAKLQGEIAKLEGEIAKLQGETTKLRGNAEREIALLRRKLSRSRTKRKPAIA
jgi:hypothetical protein